MPKAPRASSYKGKSQSNCGSSVIDKEDKECKAKEAAAWDLEMETFMKLRPLSNLNDDKETLEQEIYSSWYWHTHLVKYQCSLFRAKEDWVPMRKRMMARLGVRRKTLMARLAAFEVAVTAVAVKPAATEAIEAVQ